MTTQYVEPAHRAFADAETLHAAGRLGTPDHLYGLAAECALKAILVGVGEITQNPPQRPYKEHIDKLWPEYLSIIQGRTLVHLLPTASNPFDNWKVEHRYLDDSAFSAARVIGHRSGAYATLALLEAAKVSGVVQ